MTSSLVCLRTLIRQAKKSCTEAEVTPYSEAQFHEYVYNVSYPQSYRELEDDVDGSQRARQIWISKIALPVENTAQMVNYTQFVVLNEATYQFACSNPLASPEC